ncbi:MAG: VWA domain-containing protein, partial [Planctomycetota bacterium]
MAALAAVLLACLGAASIGPMWARDASDAVHWIDASPSCDAPEHAPDGAQRFEHSDLGRALRDAAGAGANRVLLYTDGCDTSGSPPPNPGIPVSVVLRPRRDDIGVLSVIAPPRAGARASFSIRVVVGRTHGRGALTTTRLRLFRDGEAVGGPREIVLARGATRAVTFVDRVDSSGVVRYRAQILGGPGSLENDRRETVVRIGDRPQVVVVGTPPAWGNDFDFTPWSDGLALEGFDAALVAAPLPDRTGQEKLAAAVRGGLGLLAIGAPARADSPLEALLPLTENPPDGRAVVLLLDVSGSMEKSLEALRQGYFALCARLAPEDRVAIVRFRDHVVGVSNWAPAREAGRLWEATAARGNTWLLPALLRGLVMHELGGERARHRRLYVVSDGEWGDKANTDLAKAMKKSP